MGFIEKLEKEGSGNYKMIRKLMEKGAKLEGTENLLLLLPYVFYLYSPLIRKVIGEDMYYKISGYMTKMRDKYIAKTIDKTLKPEELGILFIGASHRVYDYLPKDIELYKPPIMESGERKLLKYFIRT